MKHQRHVLRVLQALVAVTACAVYLGSSGCAKQRAPAYQPVDTQPSGQPLAPRMAVKQMSVLDGFQVTLAAAEPEVHQPIAVCYDERGRLWVAESYSYNGSDFTGEKNDRILIFDDEDGDGVFETRSVFHDRLNRLTGLSWGFGGVWVTAAPNLLFIPDQDGDDQPDGEPIIHLDGWSEKAEHNSVNGLTWGPDGWLYGRHGIKDASHPGPPHVPKEGRRAMSSGIWRYHPTRHVFEIVAEGTINPWGMDFDDHGQMFINTSVVDHLWHVVPGSQFLRWQDRDVPVNAHNYELMTPTSDHSHRPGVNHKSADSLPGDDGSGGGHSHSSVMIYLGDRWPEHYRGTLFMNNVMGRRINREQLVRSGGTGRFIARHAPDFLEVNDPWFRGIALEYGPDGDAIFTDWSDRGECHDRDGVHRRSGRIYKLSWGAPRRVKVELEHASNEGLVALQLHRNDWFVRHARRLLQERAGAGGDFTATHRRLREIFEQEQNAPQKLRALWVLHVTGGADATWLAGLLEHPEESVRYWATRLLIDRGPAPGSAGTKLVDRARVESSWLVRMALASALPSVDEETRWQLGAALGDGTLAEEDPNLVRLLWSGWQSVVASQPDRAMALALKLGNSRLRQWIPRRIAEAAGQTPSLVNELMSALASAPTTEVWHDFAAGMEAGLKPGGELIAPADFSSLQTHYQDAGRPSRDIARLLGAKLGDSTALDLLRVDLRRTEQPDASRVRVLQAIAALRPSWLGDELLGLIERGELTEPALRVLATVDDPRTAPAVLSRLAGFGPTERAAAVDALLARPGSAHALLDAIAGGRVAKTAISQFQARQAVRMGDDDFKRRLDSIWGALNTSTPGVTHTRIQKLRATLKDEVFMRGADLRLGQGSFEQRCASCHTLFDRGGKLGPDLTGSGRKDLDYLLINILDPNAAIPADWRLTVVTLVDGRVVSGSVAAEREDAVVLQTAEGTVTLDRSTIRSLERLTTSLMPTGLVDDMTAEQIRDLFAFLMSDAGSG